MTQRSNTSPLSKWRRRGIGILRITFGLVWAVDAWFKWQPDFINNFTGYLTGALDGQPTAIQAWINLWINVIKINPHIFAYADAVAETLVAIGLIFGTFSNLTDLGGALLSLVIWSTAEGFGGPYLPGSTDIGTAIIYVFVFGAFYFANAGLVMGLDQLLTPVLGRLSFLASGSFHPKTVRAQKPSGAD